jgi:hypothetical protein
MIDPATRTGGEVTDPRKLAEDVLADEDFLAEEELILSLARELLKALAERDIAKEQHANTLNRLLSERAERDEALRVAQSFGALEVVQQKVKAEAERDSEKLRASHLEADALNFRAERDRLRAVAEAARDPFLVLLESHPDADGHVNAEMARAAQGLRAALAALEEKQPTP